MENASFFGGYFEGAVVSDSHGDHRYANECTCVGTRDMSRSQARVLENNGGRQCNDCDNKSTTVAGHGADATV